MKLIDRGKEQRKLRKAKLCHLFCSHVSANDFRVAEMLKTAHLEISKSFSEEDFPRKVAAEISDPSGEIQGTNGSSENLSVGAEGTQSHFVRRSGDQL